MIILEQYAVPERGEFEVYVKRKVNLRISSEEARRQVNHWLLDQVSCMIGAELPDLMLNEAQAVWQVPAILTASHVGRVGVVGYVAVDVENGEIRTPLATKEALLESAKVLVSRLPVYQPHTEMPAGYQPPTLVATHAPGRPQGNPLDLLPRDTHSVPV